jgi:outer membrane protein assembly factor BamB
MPGRLGTLVLQSRELPDETVPLVSNYLRPMNHPRSFSLCVPTGSLALGAFLIFLNCGADWPQFLGPERNGVSTDTNSVSAWQQPGPPVVWSRDVGPGYSGPVVSGGRLIVFHRLGSEEVVECLSAADGKPRWKFAYPTSYADDYGKGDGPRSTPLVYQGRVYTLGAEGRMHCLDFETGRKVWERALNEEYRVPKNFFGVGTSPLAEGGLILVNVGSKQAGIVALAADSGKEIWRATDHEASYSSPIAATIDGVRHALFFTRQGLVSVDPKNGNVRFSKPWRSRSQASVNAATPVLVGDLLFLSASYNTGAVLLRLRREGADEIWKNDESLSNHYTTSLHHDGYLYGFDGRQEEGARLRCIELRTGKVAWTKDDFGCGSMVLTGGILVILSEAGNLVLAEAMPSGYREKARTHVLSPPCRAPIALCKGVVYARDEQKLVAWKIGK